MLWPNTRMIWFSLALAVPALTLAGIKISAWPLTALILVVFATVLATDAQRLNNLLEQATVCSQGSISAYKDRLSALDASVTMPAHLASLQLALDLPLSFQLAEPVALVDSSGKVLIAFRAEKRGEFSIVRAFMAATSPWGLWSMRVERAVKSNVRVYPDLNKDPAARRLFAAFQQGQQVQRVIGRGREVERLRDYAPGDSFDEVYWKGTARRGSPISKVFQVERTQDIYAIVDGSRLGNRNEALERFVSAALMLAVAAEKNADKFGLLTFTDRVHEFVRASHGKGHFHRCRESVFDLQPASTSPDFGELFTFINLHIRKRALLFFLTDLSDPLLAETFTRDASFIARRHVAMVNQIADAADRPLFSGALPTNDSEVQTRLAGHLQWAKLRELERGLAHIGIHMHLLKPEQASAELISQYLTIKQRQLL